jgi:hypothetical protein
MQVESQQEIEANNTTKIIQLERNNSTDTLVYNDLGLDSIQDITFEQYLALGYYYIT